MDLIYVFLRAALAVLVVIGLTRLNGLRSFSKMSGFDFAITVAKGSVLAAAVMADSSMAFWGNLTAMVALFMVQGAISRLRLRRVSVEENVDNDPLMLMRDGEIFERNLEKGQITRSDLMGKLREANVLDLSEVRAVVLEVTGDVSVLHGEGPVDDALLDGIRV